MDPACPENRPAGVSGGSEVREDGSGAKNTIALVVLLLGLASHLFVVARWARQPLLDQHAFRQTQTALSAYWLVHQPGWTHWLDYETPVFGSPWQIPLEFPLYQWLAAAIHWLTDWPLDAIGRCLSALLFCATFWPLAMLARDFGLGRRCLYLSAGLLLLSPIYAYWSRAFLCESTVLLLSLLYLAWLSRWLQSGALRYIVVATAAGVLAALTKVTTFAGFAAAGGVLVAAAFIKGRGWKNLRETVHRLLPAALSLGVCLVCLIAWLRHSDLLKAQSLFGDHLISSRLSRWNYGTIAQRTSHALWNDTILRRTVSDTVGSWAILVVCGGSVFFMNRRVRLGIAVLAGLFLVPFLLFTPLHIIHNYYQYANAVFLVLAAGLCLWQLSERFSAPVFALVASGFVLADAYAFTRHFLPDLRTSHSGDSLLQAAAFLRDTTPKDSVLLVVGCDWDPALPYYSRRRAICIPAWATRAQLVRVLQDPLRFSAGNPIGAVVELLGVGRPIETELWRDFADRLALGSSVKRFSEYRIILPGAPATWRLRDLSVSLPGRAADNPSGSAAQGGWAKLPPTTWQTALSRAGGEGRLEQADLAGHPMATSRLSLAKPGDVLNLRGWAVDRDSKTAPPEIVLALVGSDTFAARYTWGNRQPRLDLLQALGPGRYDDCGFEVHCRLPNDLPEDNYEAELLQYQGGALVPVSLGMQLRIQAPWSEELPEGWAPTASAEVWGNLEDLRVNGAVADPSAPDLLLRPGTSLQIRAWVTDHTQTNAPPEVMLALRPPNGSRVWCVRGMRCWRFDVSKAYGDTRFDHSGVRVRCTIPAAMPPGVYTLSLLQKSGDKTTELPLKVSLRIGR